MMRRVVIAPNGPKIFAAVATVVGLFHAPHIAVLRVSLMSMPPRYILRRMVMSWRLIFGALSKIKKAFIFVFDPEKNLEQIPVDFMHSRRA